MHYFPGNYKGHTYTKNYLFIWNSNLTEHLSFVWPTYALHPTTSFGFKPLRRPDCEGLLGQQGCRGAALPQGTAGLRSHSQLEVILGKSGLWLSKDRSSGSLWMPAASQDQALVFWKKKIKSNKERTVSPSELHKCTHLAHSSNWASRFVLLKRKLASLALKQPWSGEINTEDAKS